MPRLVRVQTGRGNQNVTVDALFYVLLLHAEIALFVFHLKVRPSSKSPFSSGEFSVETTVKVKRFNHLDTT